jgi:DNA-binding LacI/PurR family transcriptional regulator
VVIKVSKKVRRAGKTRIQEVANEGGVSIATVSRVINGSDSVTPELRERVIKAARKLNYNLDGKNKARIIAFILSNRAVFSPFHASVLVGAESYCAAHDYGLLYMPLRYPANVSWQNLHLPQILQRRDIIGAVIVAGTNSQNLLDLLSYKGIPFVVLGNNVVGEWNREDYSAVYFDDIEGAYEVTRYLLSLGHQHIWYVGNCRMPWFARRYEGYRRAMAEAGLPALLNDFDAANAEEVGYLATKSIIKSGEPVTAVFAGEDAAARGTYKAIQESGLRIPHEISVVGFNDTPEAAALNPPLTSVKVFTEQAGKQMAELVLKKIGEPELGPEAVTIPTQLVKRESCRLLVQAETAPKAESIEVRAETPAATAQPSL